MTNHYHLFVRTPDTNLSRFMQHVQEGIFTRREARQVALWLLARHSRG